MSEHPDRPAVDPGAGEPPAPWASSGSPVGAPDTQGEPTQVLDSVPTAPLSQSFPPPPSGGVFGPPYAAPPPPDLGPDYPPVGPGPTAERSTGHAPGGFPAPGFPAPGYPAPGHPPAGSSPAMAYPSLGASQTPARRSRLGAGALALAAVVGLVAGLLGGVVGSALVNRGVAVTQGQSPLPAPLPGATTRPEGSIAKIAATALPSVVTVTIVTADATGNGSGFVIDRAGHILTNNHVVSGATGAGEITVEFVDGTSLPARIVGRDSSYDLAVLAVDRTELTPLQWGRSADVVVGDGVIAVGAPLGLEATVTSGIVSALNRPVTAVGGDERSFINAIQTDAAINPGNSGGPLLDMSGRVVGINSAIARDPGSSSVGNIGVGFAIPSDQAAKTAQQLIATGKAEHPIIGVKLDSQYSGEGARIAAPGGVSPGTSAEAAGLQDGDVVVQFDGKKVAGANQLVVAIRAKNVGDTVRLTVRRAGQTVDVTLTLQASN